MSLNGRSKACLSTQEETTVLLLPYGQRYCGKDAMLIECNFQRSVFSSLRRPDTFGPILCAHLGETGLAEAEGSIGMRMRAVRGLQSACRPSLLCWPRRPRVTFSQLKDRMWTTYHRSCKRKYLLVTGEDAGSPDRLGVETLWDFVASPKQGKPGIDRDGVAVQQHRDSRASRWAKLVDEQVCRRQEKAGARESSAVHSRGSAYQAGPCSSWASSRAPSPGSRADSPNRPSLLADAQRSRSTLTDQAYR